MTSVIAFVDFFASVICIVTGAVTIGGWTRVRRQAPTPPGGPHLAGQPLSNVEEIFLVEEGTERGKRAGRILRDRHEENMAYWASKPNTLNHRQ